MTPESFSKLKTQYEAMAETVNLTSFWRGFKGKRIISRVIKKLSLSISLKLTIHEAIQNKAVCKVFDFTWSFCWGLDSRPAPYLALHVWVAWLLHGHGGGGSSEDTATQHVVLQDAAPSVENRILCTHFMELLEYHTSTRQRFGSEHGPHSCNHTAQPTTSLTGLISANEAAQTKNS